MGNYNVNKGLQWLGLGDVTFVTTSTSPLDKLQAWTSKKVKVVLKVNSQRSIISHKRKTLISCRG